MSVKHIRIAVLALVVGTVAMNVAAEAAYVPHISVALTRPNEPVQFNRVKFSNPVSVRPAFQSAFM